MHDYCAEVLTQLGFEEPMPGFVDHAEFVFARVAEAKVKFLGVLI